MLNRNQKRFRKQMEKIHQEERKNGSKEIVLSYIEGDFIDYYSSSQRKIEKQRRKKKRSMSMVLTVIVVILLLAYSRWSPSLNNQEVMANSNVNPTPVVNPATVPQFTKAAPVNTINPIQNRVIQYLKYIENADQEVNPLIDYTISTYGTAWKDPNQQRQYLDQVQNNQKRINEITAEAMQNKHPEELEEFYQTVIQKYKTMSQVNAYASAAVLNRDKQSDSQLRVECNNMNLLRQEQLAALTKGFDRAGIRWEKTENSITYHVNGL